MRRYLLVLILLIAGIGVYFYFSERYHEKTPPPQTGGTGNIILYFSSKEEEYLVPEFRQIMLNGPVEDKILMTLNELVKGSKGLINVIPEGVRVNGVKMGEDRVLSVDFSKELKERHPGGSWAEMLTIYSIVDTIIKNFPDIKRVKILIEGEEIETLAGHIDTRRPLTENKDIVKNQF